MLYKLFYTHNRSKDIGQFLKQNLFKDVHAVREEEATWGGRLPRAFLQFLTSAFPLEFLWNSSDGAIIILFLL